MLSWVLAGIYRLNALRDALIFKGGTALKKCYFVQYRFSEDLDFSGVGDVPTGDTMEEAMRAACEVAGATYGGASSVRNGNRGASQRVA